MRLSCLITTSLMAVSLWAQPSARQWNQEATAGWNLGNQLECPPPGWNNESTSFGCPANHMQAETAWGNPVVTQQMIQAVKDAGINAVRIPVRWQCHISNAETMTIDADWLQRVKEVVGYALNLGMKVLINTHHDEWLESRPTNYYKDYNNQKLTLLWTNIANAFKDYDYNLAFAGTNEVHVPDNYNAPTAENQDVQNSYNQTFVNAVRATGGNNLKRHLIVQTYNCSLSFGLSGFTVPTDLAENANEYMTVEIHYYEPWDYCGDDKYFYWGDLYKDYGSTPPNHNEQKLQSDMQQAFDTWSSQGLGVLVGEWGITDHWLTNTSKALIHENMSYYCKTLVSECLKRGFSTFVWDNNSFASFNNYNEKFGIFDRGNNMTLKADWIVNGIKEGIATGIEECTRDHVPSTMKPRKFVRGGRLLIQKGDKNYTLQGYEF